MPVFATTGRQSSIQFQTRPARSVRRWRKSMSMDSIRDAARATAHRCPHVPLVAALVAYSLVAACSSGGGADAGRRTSAALPGPARASSFTGDLARSCATSPGPSDAIDVASCAAPPCPTEASSATEAMRRAFAAIGRRGDLELRPTMVGELPAVTVEVRRDGPRRETRDRRAARLPERTEASS